MMHLFVGKFSLHRHGDEMQKFGTAYLNKHLSIYVQSMIFHYVIVYIHNVYIRYRNDLKKPKP